MKISEQMKEAQSIIEGMEEKGITDQDMKAIAVIISGVVESYIRSGAISTLEQKAMAGIADRLRVAAVKRGMVNVAMPLNKEALMGKKGKMN